MYNWYKGAGMATLQKKQRVGSRPSIHWIDDTKWMIRLYKIIHIENKMYE